MTTLVETKIDRKTLFEDGDFAKINLFENRYELSTITQIHDQIG